MLLGFESSVARVFYERPQMNEYCGGLPKSFAQFWDSGFLALESTGRASYDSLEYLESNAAFSGSIVCFAFATEVGFQ